MSSLSSINYVSGSHIAVIKSESKKFNIFSGEKNEFIIVRIRVWFIEGYEVSG